MKKCFCFVVSVLVAIAKVHGFPSESISKNVDNIPWMSDEVIVADRIRFYLYTQQNASGPVEIVMDDIKTLASSSFDYRNPTAFMINGWKAGLAAGTGIRNALLDAGQDKKLNFIEVDWGIYSHFENYTMSQQLCPTTGKVVAQFIDWMHDNARLAFDTLTLFGTSMGAQVAGFAGKNVQRGQIHRIVAMDPALPLFPYDNPKERLADTDAYYVESIHTNGGNWGFYRPIGKISIYPNGGKYQPGCGIDLDHLCSHNRAALLVEEALKFPGENKFHAVKCDHLEHVGEQKCDQYESIIKLGDPYNAHMPRGIYYLETNSDSPYAKGIDGLLKSKLEIK